MTRLRKITLEELQRCNYSAITTRNYLRVVADFAKHFGKSPSSSDLRPPTQERGALKTQHLTEEKGAQTLIVHLSSFQVGSGWAT